MSFFHTVIGVLAENPKDFAQAVFSRTGHPQEAKYLFLLMLLNGMLQEDMLLTERGEQLVEALSGQPEGEETHLGSFMRFMCEDAEFACSRIEPDISARIAACGEEKDSPLLWREKAAETTAMFPDREQLVRIACHIHYADVFRCSFNEAVERLAG